jgi:hypothetical protein
MREFDDFGLHIFLWKRKCQVDIEPSSKLIIRKNCVMITFNVLTLGPYLKIFYFSILLHYTRIFSVSCTGDEIEYVEQF